MLKQDERVLQVIKHQTSQKHEDDPGGNLTGPLLMTRDTIREWGVVMRDLRLGWRCHFQAWDRREKMPPEDLRGSEDPSPFSALPLSYLPGSDEN